MDDKQVMERGGAAEKRRVEGVDRPDAGERLWEFANRVYADPRVAAACLRAQDEHALDVNLLLFAAWLAMRRVDLDLAAAEGAAAHVAAWHREVVVPLRRTRRRWRDGEPPAGTYEALKSLELEAERHELEALEVLAAEDPALPGSERGSAADSPAALEARLRANLRSAVEAGGAPAAVADDLATVLVAAYSGARNPPD